MSNSRSGSNTGVRARLSVDSLEERVVPAGVQAAYAVTQDWTSGFQAEVRLTNKGSAAVPFNALSFTLPASISSLWDAKVVSHTGTQYQVSNAGWNTVIPAGGMVTFGFVASGPSTASGFALNGIPLDGTSPPPPALPTVSVADVSVREGNTGTTGAVFAITLSTASTTPITVKYATADGTAKASSDYSSILGTVTFAPGETTKTVSVAVIGDTDVEPDESFTLGLSTPSGATLGRSTATGTIQNDDISSNGDLSFQVLNDWGSGLTGQITIHNSGTSPISNWTLSFDLPGLIGSLWNGKVLSHTGTSYVVAPADWNSTIPAGGTASIGFTTSPGGITATNLVLATNGGPLSPPPPPANRPPVAVNDAVHTDPSTAARVSVLANDTDPDGDPISVTAVGTAAHGTVVRNTDGTITYTPTTGYTGLDTFTYSISDGRGGTASGSVTVTISATTTTPSSWPAHVFAPYVDATLWPTYDFVATARTTGVKYFTLAFITSDSQNLPAWGGYSEYAVSGTEFDLKMQSQIASLRALGGDVVVSFGGASGLELAQKITDVNALTAAYRSVVQAYGLTHIDFDIEGAAVADKASIDRRSQAIANLQTEMAAASKELNVSFTLPVLPTGLTADGLYVLQSAKQFGVHVGVVNVMAMDYGDSAAPNPSGHMGDYAIQAGNSLFTQLTQVFGSTTTEAQRWQMIGVTPMIGVNDVQTEVFDQQEARELLAWAQSKGIGRLSMWSLNRDQQNSAGAIGYVDLNSSSILQSPLEFSNILGVFTG
ncbi:MAG: cellulose binding domain-containing protein [Planctomycetes bacterium]|nr:cellulose binding domain-containing protein [Planctomycetota bacterium]